MVLVAVTAVLIEGELMRERRAYCLRHARYCRKVASQFRAIRDGLIPGTYRFRSSPTGPEVATTRETRTAWANYFDQLGRTYDRAARRPWLSIPPDPPFPE